MNLILGAGMAFLAAFGLQDAIVYFVIAILSISVITYAIRRLSGH